MGVGGADWSGVSGCCRLMRQESVNGSGNENKPFSSLRRDAEAAAYSSAGLPLIYPSGGRKDCIPLFWRGCVAREERSEFATGNQFI